MKIKTKILLIEDDKSVSNFIQTALENGGYKVVSTATGATGTALSSSFSPDVILLDLGLPDMDGSEIIKKLRGQSKVPIIVISARSEEQDKVHALDLGADDYITKPFGSAELMARIRTSLRHSHMNMQEHVYKSAGLEINFERRSVRVDGRDIHLTQNEYHLLTLLAENSGKVLTYRFMMNSIWGPYVDDNNQIIRVNMANIRRKIESNPAQPRYIFTEIGIGYRMVENENV